MGIPTNVSEPRRQFFVAVFGRDGHYDRLVTLPSNINYFAVAILDSENFIVSGFDPVNEEQRLFILDSTGRIVRSLDQPMQVRDREKGLVGVESATSTHFSPYGENVLVWRMGKDDPLIEVGSRLNVREIDLRLPKGQLLVDIVPSDLEGPILAHLGGYVSIPQKDEAGAIRPVNPGGGVQEIVNARYFTFSPQDGSMLRRLTFNNPAVSAIACRIQDQYLAFSTNDKKQLLKYQGQ